MAVALLIAVALASLQGADAPASGGTGRASVQASGREPCARQQALARASPANGAILADLAACLARIGRAQDAIRWSLAAAELDDGAARLRAYMQLRALDYTGWEPAVGQCTTLPSNVPRCDHAFTGCAVPWGWDTGEYARDGAMLRIYADARDVPQRAPDVETERDPAFGRTWTGEAPDEPPLRFYPADVGSFGAVDVVLEEWFRLGADTRPQGAARSNPPAGDGALVASLPPPLRCWVVVVDACRGRVGLACRETRGGRVVRAFGAEVDVSPARAQPRRSPPAADPKPAPSVHEPD